MRWSYTRHRQYEECKSNANYWVESRPTKDNHILNRITAMGVLVHRTLESLLRDHIGETVSQAYRSIRPRDLLNCLNAHYKRVEFVGCDEIPPPKITVMKSMVQNGLRHIMAKWPNATIHAVEWVLEVEDTVGIVDLALIQNRREVIELILVDWKTRNARPIATNNLQLAVYENISNHHVDSDKTNSYLALIHPRQNTMLMVTNSEEFRKHARNLIQSELEEWSDLIIGSVFCSCGQC